MDPISLITVALPLVLKWAPHLLGLFAGPTAENAAARTIDAAQATFGTIEHDKIEQMIAADKNKLAQFQAELEERTKETQAYLADVQSARTMLANAMSARSANQYVPLVITILVFATFIFCFWGSIEGHIGASNQVANQLVGAVILAFGNVIQFWVGSSKGSDEKSAVIAGSLANMQQQNRTMSTKAADAASKPMFR